MKLRTTLIIALASVLGAGIASAQQKGTSPKPASAATKAANLAMQQNLDFNSKEDFENIMPGFIGKPETLTIKNAEGRRGVGPRELQGIHQFRQASARHRQPEPVAQRAAQHAVWAVQGDATASTRFAATTFPTSPSSKVIPADRLRSADFRGDGEGGVDLVNENLGKSPWSPSSTAIRTLTTTAVCVAL